MFLLKKNALKNSLPSILFDRNFLQHNETIDEQLLNISGLLIDRLRKKLIPESEYENVDTYISKIEEAIQKSGLNLVQSHTEENKKLLLYPT